MGSGASSLQVYRRRALIRQHHLDPNVVLATSLRAMWSSQTSIRTVAADLAQKFHLDVDMAELHVALETLGCVSLDAATDLMDVEPLVAFCMPRKARMIFPAVSIWLACKKGDVDGLKAWLAIDGDPTWRLPDAFGNLPIYYASLCGHSTCVQLLLSRYEREAAAQSGGFPVDIDALLPPLERQRCITNALHGDIRRLLELQTTEQRSRFRPELTDMAKEDDDDEDIVGTTNWDLFETN
ncbi:hypothetical protein LEN26_010663 [Aphanomyces euteiches]|nr:hypothetical protein LEN26_010663 [Aphanomyces euteiches]